MLWKAPKGFGYLKIDISQDMLSIIADFANGDARTALNTLEMAVTNGQVDSDKTTWLPRHLNSVSVKKIPAL